MNEQEVKTPATVTFTVEELRVIVNLCDIAWEAGKVVNRKSSEIVARVQDKAREAL